MGKIFGLLLLLISASVCSCAHKKGLAGDTVIVSLQDFADDRKLIQLEKQLGLRLGVRRIKFDPKRAELSILYYPKKVTPDQILQGVRDVGVKAQLGNGAGTFAQEHEFQPEADVKWASQSGERTALENFLSPQKVTVFLFYAKWSHISRVLNTEIAALMEETDTIALRHVLFEDWASPVALQYSVTSLPYIIVYSDTGKWEGELKAYDPSKLKKLIGKAHRLPRKMEDEE